MQKWAARRAFWQPFLVAREQPIPRALRKQDRYSCMEFDFPTCDRPWGNVPLIFFQPWLHGGGCLRSNFLFKVGSKMESGHLAFSSMRGEKRCNFEHIKQRGWITEQGVIKRDGKVLPACLGGQVWLFAASWGSKRLTLNLFLHNGHARQGFVVFLVLFYGNLEFQQISQDLRVSNRGSRSCRGWRTKEQRPLFLHVSKEKEWACGAAGQPKEVENVITRKLSTLWESYQLKISAKANMNMGRERDDEREWENPKRGKAQGFYWSPRKKSQFYQLYPSQRCGRTPTGNWKWKSTMNTNLTCVGRCLAGQGTFMWCCFYCPAVLCSLKTLRYPEAKEKKKISASALHLLMWAGKAEV